MKRSKNKIFITGFILGLAVLSQPFGGKILSIVPPNPLCFFTTIVVGPPNPGVFAIVPSTKSYLNYQIFRPGPWVLGLARRVPACVTALPIQLNGTSL